MSAPRPPSRVTVEDLRQLLEDHHPEHVKHLAETSLGFRVWKSAWAADQVYVEVVRSNDKFQYESTNRSMDERLAAYEKTVESAGYVTRRQLLPRGVQRFKVNLPPV